MKTKIKLVLLALLLLLAGLTGNDAKCCNNDAIEGVWQTEGYGMVLEATGGKVTVYQITAISGIKMLEGTYSGNTVRFGPSDDTRFNYLIEKDHLVLDNPTDGSYYRARRIDRLPQSCFNGGTQPTLDPEFNFEIFWRSLNEQYAFFQLRGVNWDAQYRIYRSQVTRHTPPQQLFDIMCQMVEPLQDAHVTIEGLGQEYRGGVDLTQSEQAMSYFRNQAGVVSLGPYGYLIYRNLQNNVGLLTVFAMGGYSESGDLKDEAQAVDKVIEALSNNRAIIIDMRFNMGGSDAISRLLAGRFADRKRLVYSKQARNGPVYTPLRDFYVEPQGSQQYQGQVIVLTSSNTVSAGEVFIMCMKVLPNVIVIGERTNGAHSDVLVRKLPNGWKFGVSNERYYAADKQVYEKIGLQPDINIAFEFNEIFNGTDRIMQVALEYAEKQ